MPDGQHPPERLRRYLKDLNPEARASLLADLEAGALRRDQLPEADLILGELRRMHTVPREHPSPQQLLFAPLTPFVIDDNPARKHPGRIARGSLEWIWQESQSFRKFRGEAWMPEPCRSCNRRGEDFGGCRCQAFLLTGDAAATDPACSLAPAHRIVELVVEEANSTADVAKPEQASSFVQLQKLTSDLWSYRTNPE